MEGGPNALPSRGHPSNSSLKRLQCGSRKGRKRKDPRKETTPPRSHKQREARTTESERSRQPPAQRPRGAQTHQPKRKLKVLEFDFAISDNILAKFICITGPRVFRPSLGFVIL